MGKPIGPDFVYEHVSASAPRVSRDGSRLVFVETRVDREAMQYRSRIMMRDLPDGEARAFTSGDSDGSPQFSPDGKSVAFLRPDDAGLRQLWLIPANGGEAGRLTSEPGGGDRVRLVARFADAGVHLGRRPGQAARRPRPHPVPAGARGDQDPLPRRLGGLARQRLPPPVHGRRGGRRGAAARGRRGRRLLPGVVAPTAAESRSCPAAARTGTYAASPRCTSCPRAAARWRCWSDGLAFAGGAAWSPDGQRIVTVGSENENLAASNGGMLYVLEAGTPPQRITDGSLTLKAGAPPTSASPELAWTDDDRIVFLADSHGESYICDAPVSGEGAPRAGRRRRAVQRRGVRFAGAARGGVGELANVAGRAAAPGYGQRRADVADFLRRGVLRRTPAGGRGAALHRARGVRGARLALVPAGLRPFGALSAGGGHPRRAARRLLPRIRPAPADACHGGLHRAHGQSQGLVHLRHGLHGGGAGGLGRRGLPGHHGGRGRSVGAALRGTRLAWACRATATAAT